MRKLIFTFAPATLSLFALIACESDSPGGGPNPVFDGGVPDWNAPPAPPLDGGAPDAPHVPAVSVTVTDWKGPKSGVRVVFHDASGAVLETKLTGIDGKAIRTGEMPSMASVLIAGTESRRIVTWTGVEEGDDLQVRADEGDEHIGMYTVTFPSDHEGAGIYEVASPCGRNSSYGTGAELPLYSSCVRPQNAALATARTFSGNVLAHAFKKGTAAVTDGGTGAVTLGDWAAPSTFTMNLANVPDQGWFEGRLLEIADGAGFDNHWGEREGSTVTFPTATGFADAYQASLFVGMGGIERAIAKRVAPSATMDLDYAELLPTITEADVSSADPRRPVVTWTTDATAANTDGGLARLFLYDPNGSLSWTFVVPPGATTVTAPALPEEAEDFLPPAADSGLEVSFTPPRVILLESDVLSGYRAFRAQPGLLSVMGASPYEPLPVLPANGTYRLTSWRMLDL